MLVLEVKMKVLLTVVIGGFFPSGAMTTTKVYNCILEVLHTEDLPEAILQMSNDFVNSARLLSGAPIKMIISISHLILPA